MDNFFTPAPAPPEAFKVKLADFSGPLDLLCHLVDNREIDAKDLKLADLISQYVVYTLSAGTATLSEAADFFVAATGLILRKVRRLFPSQDAEEEAALEFDPDDFDGEEAIGAALERFKPYRRAAFYLGDLKSMRELCHTRTIEEETLPWYDLGDLYSLASLWWSLLENYKIKNEAGAAAFMDEIPDAVPEGVLVEQRMSEIRDELHINGFMMLSDLVRRFQSDLVVTLLALLEMSRLGMVFLSQEKPWDDVAVRNRG